MNSICALGSRCPSDNLLPILLWVAVGVCGSRVDPDQTVRVRFLLKLLFRVVLHPLSLFLSGSTTLLIIMPDEIPGSSFDSIPLEVLANVFAFGAHSDVFYE